MQMVLLKHRYKCFASGFGCADYANKRTHKYTKENMLWKDVYSLAGSFEYYDAEEVHSLSLGYILPGSVWLFTDVLTLSGNDALWGLSDHDFNRKCFQNCDQVWNVAYFDFRMCLTVL